MKLLPLKLACLTALVLGAASPASHAALLVYEGFNYTAGSTVTGQTGGSGNWNGAWAGSSSYIVSTPGLTYTGLSTSGNAAFDNTGPFQSNLRAYTGVNGSDGSVLWMSALVNAATLNNDLRLYGLADNGVLGGDGGAGIYIGGGIVNTRIGFGSGTSSLTYTLGTTFLVVAKYEFSDTAGADKITLWVNPSLATTPTTGGASQSGNFSASWVTSPMMGFRGGNNWTGTVDEIRLGTTFADVVVPEPGAFSLACLGGLGLLLRSRRRAA